MISYLGKMQNLSDFHVFLNYIRHILYLAVVTFVQLSVQAETKSAVVLNDICTTWQKLCYCHHLPGGRSCQQRLYTQIKQQPMQSI